MLKWNDVYTSYFKPYIDLGAIQPLRIYKQYIVYLLISFNPWSTSIVFFDKCCENYTMRGNQID